MFGSELHKVAISDVHMIVMMQKGMWWFCCANFGMLGVCQLLAVIPDFQHLHVRVVCVI